VSANEAEDVVTYEAADRGAVCALGCIGWLLILVGAGFGLWYIGGGLWKLVVGLPLLLGGLGMVWYLRSPLRRRWELSFDRTREVAIIRTHSREGREEREIPFADIEAIELAEIVRDVSEGENVPYLLPVFRLRGGETVRLDREMSVRDPERAEQVADEMRYLVGLIGGKED